MNKILLRRRAFRLLAKFGDNMKAKFNNICSKTGSYSVPLELFQKRTPRKNRVLISWEAVIKNRISLAQLNSFEGGVAVEFKNNDFFNPKNHSNPLFIELSQRLGSNENVASIISIRSEAGSSSSALQREAFNKLTSGTKLFYKGSKIVLTQRNYADYAIKQNIGGKGQGNETWSGFLFISIKGGQQDKLETHSGQELTLFNPACEYAASDVCEDINLIMAYFASMSIDKNGLEQLKDDDATWKEYKFLLKNIESMLKSIEYDFKGFKGNLYNHVKNHYSVSLIPSQLTDPIQLKQITIDKFNISKIQEDSIDFTHEEAVIFEKYYWDNIKKCILSPARPTNVFWSYHLSNMMQQNYNLNDYFKYEEERFKERQRLINSRP